MKAPTSLSKKKISHLKKGAESRNKGEPNLRTAQDYVAWLTLNGPGDITSNLGTSTATATSNVRADRSAPRKTTYAKQKS
jgi:hypothetical protein